LYILFSNLTFFRSTNDQTQAIGSKIGKSSANIGQKNDFREFDIILTQPPESELMI